MYSEERIYNGLMLSLMVYKVITRLENVKITVAWDVTPCSLVDIYLPHYTAS
jgi:hypothetical protein